MSTKYIIYFVNSNLLRSRPFEAAQFTSFMRRFLLTQKGLPASLVTNISSVFMEAGRYSQLPAKCGAVSMVSVALFSHLFKLSDYGQVL
jgi:hypothetical protein